MPFASEASPPSLQRVPPASVVTEFPGGDFESLFQTLAELGPAPKEFMLGLSDPMLQTEDIFELGVDL